MLQSDSLLSPASACFCLFSRPSEYAIEQVLAARDHVPHAYYKYLFESLLGTVRDGIAECSEVRTRDGAVFFSCCFCLLPCPCLLLGPGMMRSYCGEKPRPRVADASPRGITASCLLDHHAAWRVLRNIWTPHGCMWVQYSGGVVRCFFPQLLLVFFACLRGSRAHRNSP